MNLLDVKQLEIEYPSENVWRKVAPIKAIRDLSFFIKHGETLGVVGESGCGKSSLARSLVLLKMPHKGRIEFRGRNIHHLKKADLRAYRRSVQMIFQDPYGSLNPKWKIATSLTEGLRLHGLTSNRNEERQEAKRLLEKVGLEKSALDRLPSDFSGGQLQRIGIARALAVKPELIICDEPVSALDVSVQAQILNLLTSLRDESSLSYLFITHDLAVVEHMSHRLLVMFFGEIVEEGITSKIIKNPKHPYTKALIASLPGISQRSDRVSKIAQMSSLNATIGCSFQHRCPFVETRCKHEKPKLLKTESGRKVACHLFSD